MKSKDFEEALRLYNESLSIHEESSTYANWAQAHLKLKDYSNCIKDSSKAISMDPKYIKGYYWWAMGHKALEKYEDAIWDLQMILEIEPKSKLAN